jgi:integrase/recombinase XerD
MLSIVSGKGNKDRPVPMGDKLINLLQEYIKAYAPKKWLFEGQKAGEKYGERSIQLVMKKALKVAGLNDEATLHWLRHSYATQLHESGTDIRYIQTLLGHKSSRTTEIYTHVSRRSLGNIRSPFDDL